VLQRECFGTIQYLFSINRSVSSVDRAVSLMQQGRFNQGDSTKAIQPRRFNWGNLTKAIELGRFDQDNSVKPITT
jgi:hypothetical protein